MYYGKMTPELETLYAEHERRFGYSPDAEMSLEYNDESYEDYVSDIKEALDKNISIADLFPDEDD